MKNKIKIITGIICQANQSIMHDLKLFIEITSKVYEIPGNIPT